MPRNSGSIDDVVRSALEPVVSRVSQIIGRAVARMVAVRVEEELTKAAAGQRGRGGRRLSRARGRSELTKWSADRRARRVPSFVIDATGLDTKKKIVARYGENATFEKGKPLPKAVETRTGAETTVKARPPTIRRKAKAA